MNKVYTSAVVIIPPKEIWVPIQKIRKLYDRQIDRWMPHITLIYPFKPINEFPTLKRKFSDICSKFSSFEISLKTFKYFNHEQQRYTLWLEPNPANLIVDLQTEILKIIPECDDVNNFKKGFIPHLSVGQIKGKNNLLKTITHLQEEWQELKFKINEFFFIFRETLIFEIIKRIKLQKE